MFIVGLGGTTRFDSYSERALRLALDAARRQGAEIACYSGPQIALPFYDPCCADRSAEATTLVGDLRRADGLILASPGYHGSVTGLIKNALDYVEDLAKDPRPYLDGIAVGCIGLGMGAQGAVAAMQGLRSIAHSLRGWPTPYGCAITMSRGLFDAGQCADPLIAGQLRVVGEQVMQFGAMRNAHRNSLSQSTVGMEIA
jgi:FMN reductase